MEKMNAVIIERFGDESKLCIRSIPVPEIGRNEVLIRVEHAGVGSWDLFERGGGYAEMFGSSTSFPYVLGSEGAGEVVAVGGDVTRFETGDRVMASSFLNPKGGFYAEYAAVAEETVAAVPAGYSSAEAGVVLGVGITALRGVVDTLTLRREESLCVFGSSGGIGHIAVQIGCALGARVTAVASGSDGVELVRRLGADSAWDGQTGTSPRPTIAKETNGGFDTLLLTAGGARADEMCRVVKRGGRIAYPSGVTPPPTAPEGVESRSYYGEPTKEVTARLLHMIETHGIKPYVEAAFDATEAAAAHKRVVGHHLGKIVLDLRSLGNRQIR